MGHWKVFKEVSKTQGQPNCQERGPGLPLELPNQVMTKPLKTTRETRHQKNFLTDSKQRMPTSVKKITWARQVQKLKKTMERTTVY